MYFDHLQLSLAFDLRVSLPIQFGGLYFRPSFHYPDLMQKPPGWRERLPHIRKKAQLRLALSNPKFETLFCLDPYVAPCIDSLFPRTKTVWLPDGVEPSGNARPAPSKRAGWRIEYGRQVALLFGSLAARKGVFKLLEALPLLDRYVQKKVAVVFAGFITEPERDRFQRAAEEARQRTEVQLIVDDRFVDDGEVPLLMQSADVLLVTYQHHIGSSNVLVRGAEAGIPVLGSDYGLVGAHIKRRKLGLAVDATQPAAIAEGLKTFLLHPEDIPFDPDEALRFSRENSAECFAETIFAHLNDF